MLEDERAAQRAVAVGDGVKHAEHDGVEIWGREPVCGAQERSASGEEDGARFAGRLCQGGPSRRTDPIFGCEKECVGDSVSINRTLV